MTPAPFRPTALLGPALLAAGLLAAAPAPAQFINHPNDNSKIMVHLVPAGQVGGNPCRNSKGRLTCDVMDVSGNLLEPYYAYVIITDASADSGIAGVEFGVKYNVAQGVGVDIDEWSHCGTLEFNLSREWYKSRNNGNLVTWDSVRECQRFEPSGPGSGVTAVIGYFYLTAQTPDRLEITERTVSRQAAVASCNSFVSVGSGNGVFWPRSHLGFAEFSDRGLAAGHNPCGLARPVKDATWGEVKNSQ